MSEAMKTYTADPELTALIKAAAVTGEPLLVRANEATFVVHVEPGADLASTDTWSEYDPERVRDALSAYAGSWSDLDAEELKANLYRAREEGSRAINRP